MSLLLAGAVVGASITLPALMLIEVTIGIHRQEHAASIGHRPASLSAALARRILGLHTPRCPQARRPPHRRHVLSEGDHPMTTNGPAIVRPPVPDVKEDATCP
jgi:hypothetical protein